MKELRRRWGDSCREGNEEKARMAAKMPDHRLPKSMLFWLAPSMSPQVWSKEEVERRSAKEPEGYWSGMKRNGIKKQGSQKQGGRLCIGWVWRGVEKRSRSRLQ